MELNGKEICPECGSKDIRIVQYGRWQCVDCLYEDAATPAYESTNKEDL